MAVPARRLGFGIAAGFGYLTPRNQDEKPVPQIASKPRLGQLASGPNVPPVNHVGPCALAFMRLGCELKPLEGTP